MRTRDCLNGQTEMCERAGDVPDVVFPSAIVHFLKTRRIRPQYGCADTYVSKAEADPDALITFVCEFTL
ncbi:MAG: hypothetical protein KatS3mg024_0115 [Armatimonadota bacterium]|nr:MAG: hypothetical protein KatS3mg024_0115 [Armatimonadota bacterium]